METKQKKIAGAVTAGVVAIFLGVAGIVSVRSPSSQQLAEPQVASRAVSAPRSIFGNKAPSSSSLGTRSVDDDRSVTLGLVFKSSTSGFIVGVRFYKGTGNEGIHTGVLYSSTGTNLASIAFTSESASGWQSAIFSAAVPITANTKYVITYFAPRGHYSATKFAFDRKSVTNGPLTALSDSDAPSNGRYRYATSHLFPTASFASSNYWVDVLFSTSSTLPPTTTTTSSSTTTTTSGGSTTSSSSTSSTSTSSTSTSTTSSSTTTTSTTTPGGGGGFPDAANTGIPTGTSLRTLSAPEDNGCWNWNGTDLHIDGNNCTVQNLIVPGAIDVFGANATINRVRVLNHIGGAYPGNTDNHFAVVINWTWSGGSFTMTDSEVSGSEYCVAGYGFTLTRVELTGCNHMVQATGPNITIQDSYLHNPVATPDAHTDVLQCVGCVGMNLQHDTFLMEPPLPDGAFAVLSLMDDAGCGNVVNNSKLNGASFTLGVQTGSGCATTVTNNRFGRDYATNVSYIVTPVTQSGNVWDDTGDPLTL